MIHPVMDTKWHAFEIQSYKDYCQRFFREFYLKTEVHEDIQSNARIIRNLTKLAFYEYEFFDVAVTQASLTFEMALHIRYKEISGDTWPEKKNFRLLIEWFCDRNYFETNNKEFLEHIRWTRNYKAHPKMHSFGGPMISQHIDNCIALINDLYEDKETRADRKDLYKQTEILFSSINEEGGLIRWPNGKVETVYFLTTDFINNKTKPFEFSFSFHPVFEVPKVYQKGNCLLEPRRELDCSMVNMEGPQMICSGPDKSQLFSIEVIKDGAARNKFKKWKDEYNIYSAATMHFHAISSGPSRAFDLLLKFYKD
ncbi:MAG: hypothetical protein JWN76_1578 [Chitinophagaceae bacterium]|nr:hypothetical protein [Chitinophagaceae bacterium]